jgi:hypothetical protein
MDFLIKYNRKMQMKKRNQNPWREKVIERYGRAPFAL